MKRKITIVLLCSIALYFTGCKPSVSGENQTWTNNQKDATDFSTKYPAFKDVIAQAGTQAQKLWDDAAKITKEEDKAAKMREANDAYDKILRPIGRYASYVESAEKKQTKASGLKYASSVYDRVSSDMSKADNSLSQAADMMANAKPTGLDDAAKIANDAGNLASDAERLFGECIKKAKK